MARIMEGIKELLGKGKDDDDEVPEYRNRYDQRQSPGSNRVYKNPGTATSEARSGYRRPFGEALDDIYVRNGYDTRASPRGAEYRKPYESSPRGSDYPSPRGTEYRRPYVGSEVASPHGEYVRAPLESPRDYQRSPRGSTRRDSNVVELMVPMCCDKCKEKVTEELGEVEGVESVRCDAPNSRVIVTGDESIDVERCVKKAERAVKKKCELISIGVGTGTGTAGRYYAPKVADDGIRNVTRDSMRDAGAGTAGRHYTPRETPDGMRDGTRDSIRDAGAGTAGRHYTPRETPDGLRDGMRDGTRDSIRDAGAGTAGRQYTPRETPDGMRDGTRDSIRDAAAGTAGRHYTPDRMRDKTHDGSWASPSGRPSPSGQPRLGRMPSFASGKVMPYDERDAGLDYEAKDYAGFRRMPSFGKHQHHEAEYITSFDQRSQPVDTRHEVNAIRRLPSFNRHKNHDAEYISTGDREYSPSTFYESNAGGSYASTYNERPSYRSQVSFSKLPVENPNYVKHIAF